MLIQWQLSPGYNSTLRCHRVEPIELVVARLVALPLGRVRMQIARITLLIRVMQVDILVVLTVLCRMVNAKSIVLQPFVEVVILCAPPVVVITVAVDERKVLSTNQRDAAGETRIPRLPVVHLSTAG